MVNILAYVNLYPPTTNAGAELMLHEILLELKRRGHKVTVAQPDPEIKSLDGIRIVSYEKAALVKPDIVFTQNHDTKKAIAFAKSIGVPIVHFIHNHLAMRTFGLNHLNANLVVANSVWVMNSIRTPSVGRMVINPHTDFSKYQTGRKSAEKITFVNLIDIKGADIFWQIARLLPAKKFLAVKGGYGVQMIRDLPNVEIVENTDDMKSIYSQTRILLMPSKYESWGRVAIEAMASGIPVVASKTNGLRESVGDSGILISPGDVNAFVRAIKQLDSEDTYQKYSSMALSRAELLSSAFDSQIDLLEIALASLCGKE